MPPIAQAHNNQRDGMHRQAIHRGRVSYEPNSLGGGCPFQAGAAGFTSFRQPSEGDKVRGKPEKFADHYTQATLFYEQPDPGRAGPHSAGLSLRVDQGADPGDPRAGGGHDRQRRRRAGGRAGCRSGDDQDTRASAAGAEASAQARGRGLAGAVAVCPPRGRQHPHPAGGHPGGRRGGRRGRADPARRAERAGGGAPLRGRAPGLGRRPTTASTLEVEVTLETMPSVLFDAVAVPGGKDAVKVLGNLGHAVEFLKDQYRHAKPILALGDGAALVENAGIPAPLALRASPIPGCWWARRHELAKAVPAFIKAIARHRHHERRDGSARGLTRRGGTAERLSHEDWNQVEELLLQSLEHEQGGREGLRQRASSARSTPTLKEEWKKYLDQTQEARHGAGGRLQGAARSTRASRPRGGRWCATWAGALVEAMKMALAAGNPRPLSWSPASAWSWPRPRTT